MASSTRAKGDRYAKKTKEWLEAQGYQVSKMEMTKLAWVGGRMIPIRTDILFSDLIAVGNGELLLVQVKFAARARNNMSTARKNYQTLPDMGCSVKKMIVGWQPRVKEPIVEFVE